MGWTPGATAGILRAHRQGIVTSTTLLANMPAGEDAVARLAQAPGLGVGVHLNVSRGRPLSREGLRLADEDGTMRHTADGVILSCIRRPALLRAVEAEFDAQIRWVMDRGIRPTHLDSHRHSHAFTPIFVCAARLARRYDIPFLRSYNEVLPDRLWRTAPGAQRRTSRWLSWFGAFNTRVAPELRATRGTRGIAHTGHVGAAWLIEAAGALRPGATEIMTHPGLADGVDGLTTRLVESRQAELEALCSAAVRDALERHGIELIHYGQLRQH